MIDQAQRNMFTYCGVTPADFWQYTPAESKLMIEAAKVKFDLDLQKQARLIAAIYNANGGVDGNPVKVEDLLQTKEEKPISKELYCEGWKTWVQKCKNGA